jgi:hypothetical protein
MNDLQKFIQRNFRRILAGGGLILSLLAFSILLNSGPETSVWMVTVPIPSGSKIVANEVTLVKANLTVDSMREVLMWLLANTPLDRYKVAISSP